MIKALEDIKTPSLNGPRRFEWRGETYALRTNGHLALLLLGGHDAEPLPANVADAMRGYLGGAVVGSVATADVMAWSKYPICEKCGGSEETTCEKCGGRKVVRHRCDCERCEYDDDEECPDCGGSGKRGCYACVRASYAGGVVRGKLYDRRKVHDVFALLTATESVNVHAGEALSLSWDVGAFVLLPLRADLELSGPVLAVVV